MKVLITGGAGFIGSNFLRKIINSSPPEITEITVLDKLTYAGNLNNFSHHDLKNFNFIKGDICDSYLVKKIVSKQDVIINFAAETHVDRSIKNSKNFMLTNIIGTQTLLQAALEFNLHIFLQISTDEVYGSINSGSWREDSPLLPNSPYASSKASADLICRAFNHTYGLDVRITRSSNNYGPYQYPEKIIPLIITNLIEGKKIPIYGSGLNIRDWLHVDDHCEGIYKVLRHGKSGHIYNIGGGEETSNINLVLKILELMGKNKELIEYVVDRPGHDFRYSVDTSKISHELNFNPIHKFDAGIIQTINWYKENAQWWSPLKN